MSEECGVAVGIRIRPFNERERKLGAQLCVDVDGPATILQNPPDVAEADGKGKEAKKFTFDASFWSFDDFDEDPSGYMRSKPGGRYADQQIVFDTFGNKVLDNAWEGYHCCLFAYGQTGAGKSYSMVGYGANKGIVPMACEEIFRRIGVNTDPGLRYEVLVSMVEIYNEQVQDLLVKATGRPKKGLEIRESQQLGIYIEGVAKRPVETYKAIESVVEEGTENRSVGSTLMNATSSRAHTVLTIEFKQVSEVSGATGMKVSMINLVDLAGSEKAGQTGASGDRLKEGCAINKSLSALGNVIEKLADKATSKSKTAVLIPYRDSKLTRLLQNALGGSSKTVMICAISPASSNYEETLSTLRYADRAKRIKNSATINENPQDKLIRQLREENMNLKNLVGSGPQIVEVAGSEAERLEKEAEILALEDALREMQLSFKERLKKAKSDAAKAKAADKEKADLNMPHIANLNEDELLTNRVQFAFKEGNTRIGRAGDGKNDPEVVLASLGIHAEHAVVTNTGGSCVLVSIGAASATTFVNGNTPPADGTGTKLNHGDRVVFGQTIFIFVDPAKGSAKSILASGEVHYAGARKEMAERQGELSGPSEEELAENRRKAEELEKRAREAEAAHQAAESNAAQELRQREVEYKAQIERLQEDWDQKLKDRELATVSGETAAAEQIKAHAAEMQRLEREFAERQRLADEVAQRRIEELERKAAKAAAEEEDHRQHELNMRKLEEQLMFVMPLVKEANLIAAELQRPHRLETRMQVELSGERSRGTIRVTAAVLQEGVRLYEWTPETLENRVFLLRELLQKCEEEGVEVASALRNEEDPLWDPVEVERLIGVAQVLLEGLLLQVDNQLDARILSTDGHQSGSLRVELWPVAQDGSPGIPDEEVVDDVEDLLGTKMSILLKVAHAAELPEELCNDVRVEYDYFIDEKPHQVPRVEGHDRSPKFGYQQTFVQDPVTSRFLEYLRAKTLVFRIYGRDAAAEKKLQDWQDAAAVTVANERAAQEAAEAKAVVFFDNGANVTNGTNGQWTDHMDSGLASNEETSEVPAPRAAPMLDATLSTLDGTMSPMASPEAPNPISPTAPMPPMIEPPVAEVSQETPKASELPSISQLRREQEKAAAEILEPDLQSKRKRKSKTCSIQ